MLCFSGFELDEERAELRGPAGDTIRLRQKSFDLLLVLASNFGRIVDKQDLMTAVWPNVHVADDSLFQCIRELRVALGDDRRQLIRVISGRGYLLEAEVTGSAARFAPGSAAAPATPAKAGRWPALLDGRSRWAVGAIAGLCLIAGLVVAVPALFAPPTQMTLAVMPIVDASGDPEGAAMAAGVTDRLIDGLAGIDNIQVMARSEASGAPPAFTIESELRKEQDTWTLKARLIARATGAVRGLASVSVDSDAAGLQLQQARLAAGVGDRLAHSLNALLEDAGPARARSTPASTSGKVAIEQATASINRTTRERFAVAQAMLEDALADEPDNVDVQVALVALQLRGIQMVWYDAAERAVAESHAGALLKRALAARPRSLVALEAQCRFLRASAAL